MAHIHYEMGLHLEYCKGFGVTKEDVERTEESQGRYMHYQIENRLTNSLSMHCIYKVCHD